MREDSNLHPVKPRQGPQPCGRVFAVSDASICRVFVQRSGRFGRGRAFWMLSKCCQKPPWAREAEGPPTLLAVHSEASLADDYVGSPTALVARVPHVSRRWGSNGSLV
jgi:hypothetical protein